MKDVPIPSRLALRPRDPRGYPIPYNVYVDQDGKAQFTITDHVRVETCIREKRCGLCGQRMTNGYWFVGGPLSAFHERGGYLDPPVHYDCGVYALQVCPYLAMPNYGKLIDDKLLPADEKAVVVKNPVAKEGRPEFFVLARTSAFERVMTHFVAKRPWRKVEVWMDGKKLEGEAELEKLEKVAELVAEAD